MSNVEMLLLKTQKRASQKKTPSNILKKKRDIQKKNNARLGDSLHLFQEAHFRANKAKENRYI